MVPVARPYSFVFFGLILLGCMDRFFTYELEARHTALLTVNTSSQRKIPDTLFGIFFEEINHAGAGGIWAELVNNRGFEAGGPNTPSNIAPWSIIGDESSISVYTELSSCFLRNKVALRMNILCDSTGSVVCPADGVGVYNPGFWGMNIEREQTYRLIFYVKSIDSVNITVSLTSGDGLEKLAAVNILAEASDVLNWRKMEYLLEATATDRNASLRLTTTKKGVIWLDQISLMPLDTFKGHGFRKDFIAMVKDLKPRFIRFPGGCFVEGEWLRNAFRWRETIGPWEERSGHFGDVWMYWTDDGLGYLEFLQLAEDLGASPIWVFNNGISHHDQVDTNSILPFVQDVLDSIEFARGSSNSTWGSVRAKLGHPEPFQLEYVGIGNEDCWKKNYRGNYMKFYYAIKDAYPDIKIISNCDGSSWPLDHPADLYDFHVYTNARKLFSMNKQFDHTSRSGPKAFVSEYAVTGKDAGTGSLLASLGEAAFLIGLERNSDVVEMASYAPLFVNANDRRWNPDAIVFNSWQLYGTPSYWMQQFFKESSGATFLNSSIKSKFAGPLVASTIIWQDSTNKYLKIKVVNFGSTSVDLSISVDGLPNFIDRPFISNITALTSSKIMDENSFRDQNKVKPSSSSVQYWGANTTIPLSPYSFTSIDLPFSEMKYKAAI